MFIEAPQSDGNCNVDPPPPDSPAGIPCGRRELDLLKLRGGKEGGVEQLDKYFLGGDGRAWKRVLGERKNLMRGVGNGAFVCEDQVRRFNLIVHNSLSGK